MAAVVVAAALALGLYRAGAASELQRPQQQEVGQVSQQTTGGITVSAEGSVDAPPDTAYLNLGFTAENTSLQPARQEAAAKMSAVIEKIKQLGVAPKDIQTASYNIWRDQERGVFVVSNDVRVVVRNVASASKLLDSAIAAGANNVQGVSFGIENRAALEAQAREKALQQARSKAAELARLGGVTLGGPVAISEGVAMPIPMYAADAATGGAGRAESSPIEPGQLAVNITVQVTYAIR
ncbi:MAG: SIMPL domain-containing protein [Chloroflexota bacterium]|nr:SIMPL domain-containing protein [Chloroflexota bacterium]